MKKKDLASYIGFVFGLAMIVWGCFGGQYALSRLKMFYDLPSVIITIFGSFFALMLNYPLRDVKRLLKVLTEAFKDNTMSGIQVIQSFANLSKKARREGLLSLEDDINQMDDEFLKKGFQMVVDGIEPETIKEVMELEIGEMERRHSSGINMLKSWAAYAPAFGMIGTLIGLIQMLADLDDSSKIASGMAVALITTFYGAVMANLIFTPMAAKLGVKSENEASAREMMLEGVLAIQSGVNPRIVEEKLICYLTPKERLEFVKIQASGEGVVESG